MSDASELYKAVDSADVDTALRLLESAGGACRARTLAKNARVDYGVVRDGDQETIEVYKRAMSIGGFSWTIPIAGIKQPRCKDR